MYDSHIVEPSKETLTRCGMSTTCDINALGLLYSASRQGVAGEMVSWAIHGRSETPTSPAQIQHQYGNMREESTAPE
ncbi:hypothetical protein CGLO_17573 [Colletotrichum gloeosporioides Cg-14]|uniref:Uncharacterized protein n=1 Tax=Colletotrichum gloeosporioides (strain Cg-14) TaxID=1237896 RepID=T0JTD0_COLGC|nr:hypothetical protein CGLO_17573 [Colletotrichum gloeosporioides Cg-14]